MADLEKRIEKQLAVAGLQEQLVAASQKLADAARNAADASVPSPSRESERGRERERKRYGGRGRLSLALSLSPSLALSSRFLSLSLYLSLFLTLVHLHKRAPAGRKPGLPPPLLEGLVTCWARAAARAVASCRDTIYVCLAGFSLARCRERVLY